MCCGSDSSGSSSSVSEILDGLREVQKIATEWEPMLAELADHLCNRERYWLEGAVAHSTAALAAVSAGLEIIRQAQAHQLQRVRREKALKRSLLPIEVGPPPITDGQKRIAQVVALDIDYPDTKDVQPLTGMLQFAKGTLDKHKGLKNVAELLRAEAKNRLVRALDLLEGMVLTLDHADRGLVDVNASFDEVLGLCIRNQELQTARKHILESGNMLKLSEKGESYHQRYDDATNGGSGCMIFILEDELQPLKEYQKKAEKEAAAYQGMGLMEVFESWTKVLDDALKDPVADEQDERGETTKDDSRTWYNVMLETIEKSNRFWSDVKEQTTFDGPEVLTLSGLKHTEEMLRKVATDWKPLLSALADALFARELFWLKAVEVERNVKQIVGRDASALLKTMEAHAQAPQLKEVELKPYTGEEEKLARVLGYDLSNVDAESLSSRRYQLERMTNDVQARLHFRQNFSTFAEHAKLEAVQSVEQALITLDALTDYDVRRESSDSVLSPSTHHAEGSTMQTSSSRLSDAKKKRKKKKRKKKKTTTETAESTSEEVPMLTSTGACIADRPNSAKDPPPKNFDPLIAPGLAAVTNEHGDAPHHGSLEEIGEMSGPSKPFDGQADDGTSDLNDKFASSLSIKSECGKRS